ncbi:carbonic anhydrase family protein [Snodgrassella sp. B3800]|uniref:carbonic anhydrase n=1 Tax=Snodgrassella sp. B3800 TaxID=2818039 RepID=UPI002269EA78|nr:carbonic anhydrase family protein [Snodgrassella sp. B3800]MCX8747561.1 carbonic anhydrase family protein [Snodgrassella sp. B3800]
MKKSILGLCLTLGLAGSAMAQTHWGYQGDYAPDNWGKMSDAQTCSTGKTQSPIDIFNSKTNHKLPPLNFDYRHADIKQIVDNGHSLQFNFDSNSNLTYNNKTYTLVQFHAHEPAEHTINGIRYPLELHFVHQAADHSNLVVAVFVQEGQQNSYFEKLSVFKKLAKNGSENTDILFNPEHLYPHNHSYYRYTGSLTTPPCSEPVTWILFRQPITLSKAEIAEIAQYLPKNNNRPVQQLNNRIIENN